jgi:xanthine/CO dehydrogenase XdhC/CoxF family maturation factor
MAASTSVIAALHDAAERNERVVLVTVVRVTGSSYGGVGTRMIIHPDGSTVGIVSGGCLEADLAEHARQVCASGKAKVVTYDTRADDDAVWGLGLGCNGLIDVMLEPLEGIGARSVATMLERARDASTPSILATVIAAPDADIGSHMLISGNDIQLNAGWPSRISDAVLKDAAGAFAERRRGMVREYEDTEVAFEVIAPAIRLVVCGSGPDIVPLVRIGIGLGWNITVVDHRSIEHSHPERFPGAHVVDCMEPNHVREAINLTATTAAVVMSHHYARDLGYVRALLSSDVGYIGMLGPRARTERMLADITASGESVVGGDRIFTPVGLDIGGEGPDAIALAILGEVSAVMTGSSAGHLRDQRGPLHQPADARAPMT